MIKRTLCIILVFSFLAVFMTGCQNGDTNATDSLELTVNEISKHGNVKLNVTFDEMKSAGIEIGDIITVKVGDNVYVLPVGTAYTDVDSGEMICRFDLEDNEVTLAINYGSFAEAAGIAKKQTIEENPGYKWNIRVNEIGIALKEKKGYLDEYNARNLTRTDAREDYPELTDEEFANFRAVTVSGLKENVLFRSSTPLESALGRNEYAMAATEKAGIRTVANLDDSVDTMKSYTTYPNSYYSRCAVVNPEMGYDFESEEFAAKVKECVLFIIENDGPYLIHCKEGKDRTGFFCALLEAFAGATYDEIAADYMLTYDNYYGITKESDPKKYETIQESLLVPMLQSIAGAETDVENADLAACAETYLLDAGMTQAQIDALRARLTAA